MIFIPVLFLFLRAAYSHDIICDFPSISKLMQITNASTCSTFVQQYLIPFDPSTIYWNTSAMRSLQVLMHNKLESEQPLRIGILGGSVSIRWVDHSFDNESTTFQSTLSKLFNYSRIEVYNGAIGGTGALLPAGCLSAIFGDLALDIVILEFAINEIEVNYLMRLVEQLQYRFNNNIQIILLSITSRLLKIRNPSYLNMGLSANKEVAKRYSLIRFDWSSLADKGFNITYQPKEIWADADEQHPVVTGRDWIQYSVGATLKDIYDRYLYVPSISKPLTTLSVKKNDDLCLTANLCTVEGHHVDNFKQFSHIAKCWNKVVKDVTKACAKMAYEEDFGPKCSNGTDHTIAFTVNYKSCKLYVAVVGNGERRLPALCELDVYVNDTLAHHVSLANRFFTQKAVLLLPNTLHRGEHNVTIIGRQLQVGQTCNIASIFCV
jgi:hypothetical protein